MRRANVLFRPLSIAWNKMKIFGKSVFALMDDATIAKNHVDARLLFELHEVLVAETLQPLVDVTTQIKSPLEQMQSRLQPEKRSAQQKEQAKQALMAVGIDPDYARLKGKLLQRKEDFEQQCIAKPELKDENWTHERFVIPIKGPREARLIRLLQEEGYPSVPYMPRLFTSGPMMGAVEVFVPRWLAKLVPGLSGFRIHKQEEQLWQTFGPGSMEGIEYRLFKKKGTKKWGSDEQWFVKYRGFFTVYTPDGEPNIQVKGKVELEDVEKAKSLTPPQLESLIESAITEDIEYYLDEHRKEWEVTEEGKEGEEGEEEEEEREDNPSPYNLRWYVPYAQRWQAFLLAFDDIESGFPGCVFPREDNLALERRMVGELLLFFFSPQSSYKVVKRNLHVTARFILGETINSTHVLHRIIAELDRVYGSRLFILAREREPEWMRPESFQPLSEAERLVVERVATIRQELVEILKAVTRLHKIVLPWLRIISKERRKQLRRGRRFPIGHIDEGP